MTLIFIVITSIYVILISLFIIGFFKINVFKGADSSPINKFSIIIPFRNEAANLPALLNSLSKLKYPKELFEILLINDESSDNYQKIIDAFISKNNHLNIRLINNFRKSDAPKKDAIETGIENSNFDWIVTTDADCLLPLNWINTYDSFIQTNDVVFIAGLVTFNTSNSFLDKFQLLDFTALIGCTIGSFGINKPFMCNGANLCYQKNVFYAVNGFEGNNTIASGDDIFLMEKIKLKHPAKIKYLKSLNNLVTTSTMPCLTTLFSQRVRWASKTTSYTNNFAKLVSIVVFLMNFLCAVLIIKSIYKLHISEIDLWILSLKFVVDFIIILITLNLFQKFKECIYYPVVYLFYPFFNSLIAIQTLLMRNHLWKDRKF